jgi:hypothetical protein
VGSGQFLSSQFSVTPLLHFVILSEDLLSCPAEPQISRAETSALGMT